MDALVRLRGDAALAVYIDLKSPYAFIAIEPTRAMAASLGVAIDWRPFTLDIPSYLGSARLDARVGSRAASGRRSNGATSGTAIGTLAATRT